MNLVDYVLGIGPWAWVVAGVVLLALELVVPGGFLLWLGVAGIVTGLASLFQPIAPAFQFLLFGVLALVLIVGWLRYSKGREPVSDRPHLNSRAQQLVGQERVLEEPIRNGFGRIAVGDSFWRIAGPELEAGRKVRIVGHDGALLRVEPV